MTASDMSASQPLPEREAELRTRLSDLFEQARCSLASLPALRAGWASDEPGSIKKVLDVVADLLTHAVYLNQELRSLDGLTVESALASGAATAAISAVADTISILKSEIDFRAA